MDKLFKWRLQTKLVTIFLTLSLVTIGLTGLLAYNRSEAALRQSAGESLLKTAHTVGDSVSRFIIDRYSDIQLFAESPILRDESTLPADKQAFLESVTSTYVWYNALYFVDTDGTIVAASDGTVGDMSAYDWFQKALSGKVAVTDVYYLFAARGVVITLAAPVTDPDGQQVGVLASQFAMSTLWDFINRERPIGESGFVVLVDQRGRVISHPDPAAIFEEASRFTPAATLQGKDDFVEDSTIDGVSRLYGFTPVYGLEDLGKSWTVIAAVPTEEVFGSIRQLALQVATAGLVLAVIIGLLTVLIARSIAQPVLRLASMAQAITAGDLSQQVEVASHDEIGDLAKAFNTMAARLRETIGSLRETAGNLAERTRELEASQRVTFAASERSSPDELLGLVVDLVRDQFDLYHAQVYIVDEEQKAAVLRESTGYAGSQLLQKGHQIPLDATALVTRAIHTGEPVLVDDTSADPNFLPNPLLPETRSELVVPLKIGERVIGVLDAQDMAPGRFTESTVNLFQTMADQIAFLFENNELLERVTEQSETLTVFTTQLRTAADIAAQLGVVLDPERLLQQMVELMQSRFGLYHAHIYVLDEETHQLVIRAGSGEVGRVLREEGHSIPLDREKSLVARAARTQEPVLVEDTSLDPDFMPNPLLPQTRSELAVPLVVGGKALGVLDMQDDQVGRFTQTELDTYTTLAGQIAVALQNAGLFEQVEANAQATQLRLEISQALASAQTEDEVLDALIQQMSIYPNTRSSIFTVVPEAEELTIAVRRQAALESESPALEEGMRIPISQFPSLRDSVEGQVSVSSNLLTDENVDPAVREIARRTGARSQLSWPLMAGGEYLGVISVSSPEEGYFDERKLHLYQTLAEQGATALHTAHLYEETQKAAEQVREADRRKSDFLANMSHELRTPLNSIIGYTELMLMGVSEMDPDTLEDVQAIYDNGKHLLRIINDILDLAKIEAGRMELNIEKVHIPPLLEEVKTSNAGLLVNKPVEMLVEIAESLPPIEADRGRLSQILNNLVGNAIKFTDEGNITMRAFGADGGVCIEVKDTGAGMSEDDLQGIFERFAQASDSFQRRAEGTGLGLDITRHLVEMHGGTIDVHSQPGEGSTFTVRLPVQQERGSAETGG